MLRCSCSLTPACARAAIRDEALARVHGGLRDGCAATEHALYWLIFPPVRASGGPEIFEVRSRKAVLGQFGAAEHDGTGPDGQFCRWRRENAEVLACC